MSSLSRRKLISSGLAATGAASGLALAPAIAARYGLLAPDCGGVFGPGKMLTYAAQRLITGDSSAREFSRKQISERPFANGRPPQGEEWKRLHAGGFSEWRLAVDGMVSRPVSLSLADLRRHRPSRQITQLTCEEGWSFVAEWIGVPLIQVLTKAGMLPQAKYVVYFSMDPDWWDSIDMTDALHPQTILTYGMNGGELPVQHGGPLRLRVPRQLGYKSVKFVSRLTVTDSLEKFSPFGSYAWYAGV
jgi:DMSO/TMAO reductase YedYZ molybdopterin-dependent catalytic subunit